MLLYHLEVKKNKFKTNNFEVVGVNEWSECEKGEKKRNENNYKTKG